MPSIALPVSLRGQLLSGVRSAVAVFSPADLFATGSQGIWLDPSDLTTMFSDRAGTTPVTTPGTVVGLRLDKSKNGVGTNGASRRNLLTYSEQFDNAVWNKVVGGGNTVVADTILAPDGTLTADTLSFVSGADKWMGYEPDITLVSGQTYTFSVWVRRLSGSSQIRLNVNPYALSWTDVTVTSGWTRVSLTQTSATTTTPAQTCGILAANSSSDQIYIWGAQLELGSTASAYQKITADWASTMAGNHAVAPTDAARPIYGVEPKGGRRNLLERTEEFDNAYWNKKTNTTVTANSTSSPVGTSTADALFETATTAVHEIAKDTSLPVVLSSTAYTLSVYVKANGRDWVYVNPVNPSVADFRCWFDLQNEVTGTAASGCTTSITSVGNGWYRCSVTRTTNSTQTTIAVAIGIATGNNVTSYAGDITKGLFIWGAQLELGSTATNYQRVLSAYDVTESGVATCHYVQYDGSDDSLSTSAIDFTATDKMSVFAGVRFNAYTANGMVYGLSTDFTSTAGTFGLRANTASAVQILLNGTILSNAQPTVPTMPSSAVFTHLMDIGAITGAENGLRVNGGAATYASNSAGTGNFSSQPLFLGRFAGTSSPFNGRDYGIIIVGKAASATEISDTELWLSDKTAEVDVAKSISPNIYTRSGDTILDRANSIIERRTV